MNNQYVPKKFKMTIILNAMYQIYSKFIPYTFTTTTSAQVYVLECVGKALIPNCDVTKFSKLWTGYWKTERNIIRLHGDYRIKLSDIVAYANKHNIKLYSSEYFSF